MHIAVIGAGPTGLMAAHAATLTGHDVVILSKQGSSRRSRLYGSQYLHEPVPDLGIDDKHEMIQYKLRGGTLADYRQKVYGSSWDGDVSPGTLDQAHHAWDIRLAYRLLWDRYEHLIRDVDFNRRGMANVRMMDGIAKQNDIDLVISTIPRTAWDANDSNFQSSNVWASGDAPDIGIWTAIRAEMDFTVVCDASDEVGWYRLSCVYGHTTVEYPDRGKRPPINGIAKVVKPLNHTSTAAPNFLHVGRYGEWGKGILTTDAFWKVYKACQA